MSDLNPAINQRSPLALSQYEKASIMTRLVTMMNNGEILLKPGDDYYTRAQQIIKDRQVPFMISRKFPNGIEEKLDPNRLLH